MARSKSTKSKAANECRMKAEGAEDGNKRTPVDIGDPFKGKAPYFVSRIMATHMRWCALPYLYVDTLICKGNIFAWDGFDVMHCFVLGLIVSCWFAAASQVRCSVVSCRMARFTKRKHLVANLTSLWRGWRCTRSLFRGGAGKTSRRAPSCKGTICFELCDSYMRALVLIFLDSCYLLSCHSCQVM